MFRNSRVSLYAGLALALVVLCAPVLVARGTDVTFRGEVTEIKTADAQSEQITGIKVRVLGFDIPVILNADTDIEVHGDAVDAAGLNLGDFVKVYGYYSSTGIVAKEIQILDGSLGQFRLRGQISKVAKVQAGVVITLLGVDVLVDAETRIERRGPDGGFTAENLTPGMEADASGFYENGVLVAARVKVGNRSAEGPLVRFEGAITEVTTDAQGKPTGIEVETEGGIAKVIITDTTVVKGTLAKGKTVEVKGTLNEKLEVVAATITVEGSGDHGTGGGGTGNAPERCMDQIRLLPVAPDDKIKGAAVILYVKEGVKVIQYFEAGFESARSKTEYKLQVVLSSSDVVDVGSMTTDQGGKAKVRFQDAVPNMPKDKDVRDIKQVRILLDKTVVLMGSF